MIRRGKKQKKTLFSYLIKACQITYKALYIDILCYNYIIQILAIDEITPELIEKMMQDKKKKLALKTINHLVQAIGTIYNHAFNRDVIKIPSPTRLVKKFKTNNERLRYLCLEEIHELYEELKDNE